MRSAPLLSSVESSPAQTAQTVEFDLDLRRRLCKALKAVGAPVVWNIEHQFMQVAPIVGSTPGAAGLWAMFRTMGFFVVTSGDKPRIEVRLTEFKSPCTVVSRDNTLATDPETINAGTRSVVFTDHPDFLVVASDHTFARKVRRVSLTKFASLVLKFSPEQMYLVERVEAETVARFDVDSWALTILRGDEIVEAYRMQVGGQSCVACPEHFRHTRFYAANPDKVQLAVLTREGHSMRCLVWTDGEGRMWYDRVYPADDAVGKYLFQIKLPERYPGITSVYLRGQGPVIEMELTDSKCVPHLDSFRLGVRKGSRCWIFCDRVDWYSFANMNGLSNHGSIVHLDDTDIRGGPWFYDTDDDLDEADDEDYQQELLIEKWQQRAGVPAA